MLTSMTPGNFLHKCVETEVEFILNSPGNLGNESFNLHMQRNECVPYVPEILIQSVNNLDIN